MSIFLRFPFSFVRLSIHLALFYLMSGARKIVHIHEIPSTKYCTARWAPLNALCRALNVEGTTDLYE